MGQSESLLAAGFSPDEVGAWATQTRSQLGAAGFGDTEIDDYIGGKPPPVPQAFIDRVSQGNAVSRVLTKIGKGAAEGWGTPEVMSPETEQWWRDIGIFNDPAKGQASPIRSLNEAIMRPIAAGIAVTGAAFNAATSAIGKGVEGIAEEAGAPMPERLGAETTNLLNFLAADTMSRAPMTRVDRGPMGEVHDVPIGNLPRAESFAEATRALVGNTPAPHAYGKIQKLWEDHGIHPAEVVHDAARDVTISQDLLSETPKLPEAYVRAERPKAEPDATEAPLNQPQPGTAPVGMGLGAPEPLRTPEESAVLNRLSIGETDAGRPWSWSRMYTAIIDRLNPVNEAVKDTGQAFNAADDPYKLARLYAGVSGKADHWLNYGTFDYSTYADTGKSMKDILAPVASDLDGFRAYATSLRALELEGQGIKTGMDLSAARQVAQGGHNQYAPIMADLVLYQNRLAQYLRDSGVLSQDGYAAMTAKHQLYVPFQRVFGDVVGDVLPDVIRGPGQSLQARNPIHEIVGSERRVIDPIESIVRNTYLSVAMAEKNAVTTKLVDMMDAAGGAKIPRHADTISIYRNGVKEEHKVSAELASAVKGLDEESVNTAMRFASAPARALRAGATLSPDFMARNLIRDFVSAVVNTTKGGLFSPIDTVKGLMSAIHKDADFQEWLKGGGSNASMIALDRRYLQKDIAKLNADTGISTRAWNVIRHPVETLRAISELTEHATRLGEFKQVRRRALRRGLSPKEAAQEAAFASREVTLDFARRGSQVRAMNMITAFWNAQIQGTDRLARAFRDDPVGTTTKVFLGITLPSILLWMNNHDDPRYQEIPSWERDLFWIVMTPNHIFRIPKPFEAGIVFGSGVERTLDALFTEKPDVYHGFANSVFEALTPSAIPTIALPIVEQFANRSTFIDRSLIPGSVEKLLPEYEYTPNTTELAKSVGQVLGAFPGLREMKTSDQPLAGGVARALTTPILIENYIRAWTGGLGMYVLKAADKSLRDQGILPDPPKPSDTLADIPVVKAFAVRYPSASAESIQRFYDEYETRKRYMDTWKAKAKEGDLVAMRHIADMGGSGMFVQLDSIKNAMSAQSKFVRDINRNPSFSPEKKREIIDTAYNNMTTIARHGVDIMRRVDAIQSTAR